MRKAYVDSMIMLLALDAAKESQDPSTQVGAVLVSASRAKMFVGCNHFPTLANPATASREERYADVIHAEWSVVELAGEEARGSTVYCTHEPCGGCWNILVERGVAGVVYRTTSPDRRERWGCDAGRRRAVEAGLAIVEMTPDLEYAE